MLTALHAWLAHGVTAAQDPAAAALALVLTTLLLEDLAVAAAGALVSAGALDLPVAYAAVAGGTAAGDLMLYGLGSAARHVPALRRRLLGPGRLRQAEGLLRERFVGTVLLARVVPGLRLVVYAGSGLVAVPLLPFAALVAASVAAWTGALLWLGGAVGDLLAPRLGASAWPFAILTYAALALGPTLASRALRLARRHIHGHDRASRD